MNFIIALKPLAFITKNACINAVYYTDALGLALFSIPTVIVLSNNAQMIFFLIRAYSRESAALRVYLDIIYRYYHIIYNQY